MLKQSRNFSHPWVHSNLQYFSHKSKGWHLNQKQHVILTTNLELTFCKITFSFSTMASPFRFLMRFFSSFLQAYILPVARTWQAHTSPKPPLPSTRYMRKVFLVTGWLKPSQNMLSIIGAPSKTLIKSWQSPWQKSQLRLLTKSWL